MQIAVITSDDCSGHDKCPARKECPTKALVQLDPGEVVTVLGSLCHGCGDCVAACPEQAIRIKQM
ncbi:MAG: 4Fe-4S dicluster domain-containing protein [Thermoleophilia bacterium]